MSSKIKSLIVTLALVLLLGLCCAPIASAETYYVERDFKFTRSTSNQITIYGYEGSDKEITIPTKLLGYTVEYIGQNAFANESALTSITIPDNIRFIAQSAFFQCTSLKSIRIPDGCSLTGPHIFYGCTSLESVDLPSGMLTVYPQFFNKCKSLTEIRLPDSVQTIGKYAFANCDSLQAVYIPRNINTIDSTAFYNSPHAAIFGYLGTYAHTYARENNIAFYAIDQVETFKVTYYNYDGSIYWMTDVAKNGIAQPPTTPPEKPSTATHYYEFSGWEGNAVNIQGDTQLYATFTEHEIPEEDRPAPNSCYVIFLNGDNTLLSAQSVLAGSAVTAPEVTPTKADQNGKYYIFSHWDKKFDNILTDTVITPVFDEHIKDYTVTFKDVDGNTLDTQIIEHGASATAPTAPEVEGYTFKGWDKDFSNITGDITVTAQYTKNVEPTPATTGNLKIEVTAGKGFTIAFGDGAARTQGPSYYNSSAPIGAKVTVTALPYTDGAKFIGWVNTANGKVLSTNETYSFVTSGNDHIKAMYVADMEDVQMVIFYFDKGSQQWDMQYYSAGDAISFPAINPESLGYEFKGWNMTEAEIKAEIAAGNDVTVLPVWEKALVYIDIIVNGGTVTAHGGQNAAGQYLADNGTTVTANTAPTGQKFAYWVDGNGNIKSYSTEYKFYPAESIELTAVFVDEDATIEYKTLVTVDTFTPGTYGSFTVSWYVPAAENNLTFIGGGIIAVNKDFYDEATFVHGTTDTNVWDRTGSTTATSNTYVWTGPVASGQTWYAKAWVQYKTASGEIVTVYSDMFEAYKD